MVITKAVVAKVKRNLELNNLENVDYFQNSYKFKGYHNLRLKYCLYSMSVL